MKRSLNLSGKIEGNLAGLLIDLFTCISRLLIPAFIVGAAARDIIFNEYGIETGRATKDLDIAIQVENWDHFSSLKNELLESGCFKETKLQHRISYYKDGVNIDVIPFGGVAKVDKSISWPPDQSVKMSVIGFEEAFQTALSATLPSNQELEIKIASIVGQTLLKLISWNETYPERKKDAIDLEFMMRNYADAGNHDRFYAEMSDSMESEGYDYELASARFLGRDVAGSTNPNTTAHLVNLLAKQTGEQNRYTLAEDMISNRTFNEKGFEQALNLIDSFNRGLCEVI